MSKLKQIAAFGVAAVLTGYTIPTIAQSLEPSVKKPVKANPTEAPAMNQAPTLSPIAKPDAPRTAPSASTPAMPSLSQPAENKPADALMPTSTPATSDQPTSSESASPASAPATLPSTPGSTTMPSLEMTQPNVKPESSTAPASPTSAPATPATPSTTSESTSTPAIPSTTPETAVPISPTAPEPTSTPTAPIAPETAPTTPSQQSSTPSPQPTARTMVLEEETITGVKEVTLPATATAASKFTLPIQVAVVQEASVTSDTPITDKMSKDLAAWGSAVGACLQDRPAFVRVVETKQVPFMIGGTEGKIRLNANGKPVCAG